MTRTEKRTDMQKHRKLQLLGHNGVVPSFDQTIPSVVSSRTNRDSMSLGTTVNGSRTKVCPKTATCGNTRERTRERFFRARVDAFLVNEQIDKLSQIFAQCKKCV